MCNCSKNAALRQAQANINNRVKGINAQLAQQQQYQERSNQIIQQRIQQRQTPKKFR